MKESFKKAICRETFFQNLPKISLKAMVQQKIIQLLYEKYPKRSELVKELSQVFPTMSNRSIYNRLKDNISFSLDEVALITQHFKLNAQDILYDTEQVKRETTFSKQSFAEFIDEMMNGWIKEVEQLLHRDQATVFMLTNSLPFSLALEFPDLIKYRLYYMAAHLWNDAEHLPATLDLSDSAFQNVPDYCKKITRIYRQLPAVEIWGPATFHACINQINYLYQNQKISVEETLNLLQELEKLATQSKQYAKNGSKQKKERQNLLSVSSPYTLYLNDIFSIDEYTLFSWKKNDIPDVFVYHAVSGLIRNEEQKANIEKYILLLRQSATQISITNSKLRNAFFSKVKKSIQRYKTTLAISLERQEKKPISRLKVA